MIQSHNMYIILHHETSFEWHSKKLDSHSQKTCKTKNSPVLEHRRALITGMMCDTLWT